VQSNDVGETIAKKEAKKTAMRRRRKNRKLRHTRRNQKIKSKKNHVEMGKGSVEVVMDRVKVVEGEEEEEVVAKVEAKRIAMMTADRNKKLRVALTHGKARNRAKGRTLSKIVTQGLHVQKKLKQCKMVVNNINHETRELQKQLGKTVKNPEEEKGELMEEIEVAEEVVNVVEEVAVEVAVMQAQ